MTDIFGSFCMPGVVSSLHPGPDSRTVAEQLAEANRDRRGHRLFFLQDIVKMLAGNPEQSGDFRLGPAGGGDNVIAKQRTAMSRAPLLSSLFPIDHLHSLHGIVPNPPRPLPHTPLRKIFT